MEQAAAVGREPVVGVRAQLTVRAGPARKPRQEPVAVRAAAGRAGDTAGPTPVRHDALRLQGAQ